MRKSIAGRKLPSEMASRRAPRPWLATLLSVLQTGLGHVYAGNVTAGIGVAVAAFLGGVLVMLAVTHLPGIGTLVLVPIFALIIYIVIPFDAWRRAARERASDRARSPELWMAGVVFLGLSLSVGVVERRWLRRHVVEPFRLPSSAMAPTLLAGDWIYATPRGDHPLREDQLAVYRWDGTPLIKRIAGLPGDTIAMQKGRFIRNGHALSEPWVSMDDTVDRTESEFDWEASFLANPATRTSYRPTLDNWGPLIVPAGSAFVLGDNRHNSQDSRYIGFIPVDSVIKVPTEIYFSFDPETRSVRWQRVGRVVE